MMETLAPVIAFLVVGGLVGVQIWKMLGGPDKDDPT